MLQQGSDLYIQIGVLGIFMILGVFLAFISAVFAHLLDAYMNTGNILGGIRYKVAEYEAKRYKERYTSGEKGVPLDAFFLNIKLAVEKLASTGRTNLMHSAYQEIARHSMRMKLLICTQCLCAQITGWLLVLTICLMHSNQALSLETGLSISLPWMAFQFYFVRILQNKIGEPA